MLLFSYQCYSRQKMTSQWRPFCSYLTLSCQSKLLLIHLLDHVISYRVSNTVLQSQFTELSKLLMDKLTCYEKSSSTALLKSVSGSHDHLYDVIILINTQLVSCSLMLLSAQTAVTWNDKATLHFLQANINFTNHSKPKVV